MKRKQLLALLIAGGLLYNPFVREFDTLTCLANTISNNDEFDNYDYTNEEFYKMMLTHENKINEMLKCQNAYIAREGKDSNYFDLAGFREWNEKDLTKMLELAKSYLLNMHNNNFVEAQKAAKELMKFIEDSIVEVAFIAEDNKYKSLTAMIVNGTDGNVIEEDGKIICNEILENSINNKFAYASVGENNYVFNTLTAFDLDAYNDGEIELDKSPLYLINSFLLAISQPIYNPTLYNQQAVNITWDGSTPTKETTEWFYDTQELTDIYSNGFIEIKEELGLNPDDYHIKVDNSINGFRLQNSDGTFEYIIKDHQGMVWPILTELCNIQGLAMATSPDNLSTFDTSVDYSNSIKTVNAFLNDDPNYKVLQLERKNVN